MDEEPILGEDLPLPPGCLFERLAQIPGYSWDQTISPIHSSYDHWHVAGVRYSAESATVSTAQTLASSNRSRHSGSAHTSPGPEPKPFFRHHFRTSHEFGSDAFSRDEADRPFLPVLARISSHVLRLEREFHMIKSIIDVSDPECKHTVRPIDIIRLHPQPGDRMPLLVTLYENPGPNYLKELISFGPAFFQANQGSDVPEPLSFPQVCLSRFLDFAINACECLELLHYGLKTIHGEIRPDAFHFNYETGTVKLANTGNGARSFDNALSDGWSALSKELGVKNKLQFIAPEQSGRLPTEPDSRTDIYALGVLFWSMLIGKPAFDANDPVEVVQNVLSKSLCPVASVRLDIPDAASAVIQKMTKKQMEERYNTISAVKWDLQQISILLGDADATALKGFKIAQRDVSSFFTLPFGLFGRKDEFERILDVVRKVQKRQQSSKSNIHSSTRSNGSSASGDRGESADLVDASSDSGSLAVSGARSNSVSGYHARYTSTHDSTHSVDSSASSNKTVLLNNRMKSPSGSRPSWDNNTDKDSMPRISSGQFDNLPAFGRRKPLAKFRHTGRCELVTISGPDGIGKSDLIQRLQPEIRKLAYVAVAKVDRSRRAPFDPFMRVLATLLRQIFSEPDITTQYHDSIRATLQPVWKILHVVLDLPKQLIVPFANSNQSAAFTRNYQPLGDLKEGTEATFTSEGHQFISLSRGQSSLEFCEGHSATSDIQLAGIFMDILHVMSFYKVICICLDNVQHADSESASLLLSIIKSKIRCVLIVAGRPSEMTLPDLKKAFQIEGPNVTKLELEPLNEDDILDYVAATMHQEPCSSLVPLAAVVQEKSRGNPFFVRMILETCFRTHCIWYSWRDSKWEFDLDRVFSEFLTPSYGEGLGSEFVARRFLDFPPEARSILIWASLLGSTFSFSLIQKLLSGEFSDNMDDEDDEAVAVTCANRTRLTQSTENIVAGLQYLLQVYVIIPGETDDQYRFASDHYASAVASMRECHNRERMHFIIAQTKLKHSPSNETTLHSKARHICLSARLVKRRIPQRIKYRDVLYQAALSASKSGAKQAALSYYRKAIYLLQDKPWTDGPDVFYDETRELYIQIAELHVALGQPTEALGPLAVIFANAHTPACKARAYTLQSRVHSMMGDIQATLNDLFTCLKELGVQLEGQSTWEECDASYRRLSAYLYTVDLEKLLARPLSEDRGLVAIGSVMSEAISICLWYDPLTFLRIAVEMMNIYIFRGPFSQAVYLYTHLAMIAMGRFKDMDLGLRLSGAALSMLSRSDEPSTLARGAAIHNIFVNHMRAPIQSTLPILETAMEAAYILGDRYVILLNASGMASARFSLGYDLKELELLCDDATEEISDWQNDIRGGVLILAVRQAARALQGKTFIHSAEHIASDEHHDDQKFQAELEYDGVLYMYNAMLFVPLYAYGYHAKIVELGNKMVDSMHGLWSLRLGTQFYFYFALALLSLHLEDPNRPDLESSLEAVEKYKKEIDYMRNNCDANYGMWSLLLEALLHEVKGNCTEAIQSFEAALDHSQLHNWPIEEALAYELQVDLLVRRGAKRAAQAMLQQAISTWNRMSATGKAKQLAEKHEWILKMGSLKRSNDVGCQTVDSLLGVSRHQPTPEPESEQSMAHTRLEDDRKQNWLEHNHENTGGTLDISGVGLDIIDLSSILDSSQLMSSELDIDKLLTKMVNIILESCSGSEIALVITEFESQGWCVAAVGDHETDAAAYPNGLPFSEVEDKMAQQISLYTLRTKEPVLVHNVLEDERFLNVSEAYASRHPNGRSIIALPIVQANNLLGMIHIEGKPNSFTHRNLVVLRLVCNQVGISLENAFLFQEARRVSAANAAMVEAQKRALTQAREAEQKAKIAEAEANHNVKLKEDAAKAKSIFLANISHDLRTPMTGVIGLAELLKSTNLDSKQDIYVESIRVCADTLLRLINDILDFSKLEAGKMKVSSVPINLKQTIGEVVRALRYTHRDRGLETIEDFDTIDPDLLVLGDPIRLHQIYMNLLSNSYKFTPTGSVTVRAVVEPEVGDQVRLTCKVIDTGIGISEEQLVRLFRPFSQADSSTARSYGGSGLGLSICKAIIQEVLHGKIWLESQEGVGTTVTFTLVFKKAAPGSIANTPWSQDAISEKKHAQQHSARDLTMIPREKIRVCIAEDNPINQKIAVNFVQHLGLSSEVFGDGEQAVEALRQGSKEGNPFHLVLMDVQMPILDGYNATRKLRQDPDPNVNEALVIAMTASAIEGDREKCIDAGMNNYLAKPVRSGVLKNMLDSYLAPQLKPGKRLKATGPPRLGVKGGGPGGMPLISPTNLPIRSPSGMSTSRGGISLEDIYGDKSNGDASAVGAGGANNTNTNGANGTHGANNTNSTNGTDNTGIEEGESKSTVDAMAPNEPVDSTSTDIQ